MLICTGRFLQIKPEGKGLVMMANLWNTSVLLLFIPLVAILLISGHYLSVDVTHLKIGINGLLYMLEAVGIVMILYGSALIVFGFLSLRRNFQPSGFMPREKDKLVTSGVFSWIQHPLYAGVMGMTLGVFFAVQSLFILFVLSSISSLQ